LPADAAREVAQAARTRGYDSIFREHSAAWHDIWKTDILVDGDPALQKVIHSTIFYLLGSVREGTEFDIPPMGLSSSAYVGHLFWDSDTFMYPALLLLHPEMAKSMMMFRCRTLDAARTNAQLRGYRGAMYPWEADETGAETTPHFAWDNALKENHVTSDVALAVWQYYLATGDRDYLASCAHPVLKAAADYWVSRSTYNKENDRYEIRDVVSSDEGSRGVHNDVATNVGAITTLRLAIRSSNLLGKPVNSEWQTTAGKMYVPYNSADQYFPEFEGAPAWERHVGHVTPLISYPYEYAMSDAAKRNTLENALKSITSTGGGAFLLPTLYPMVAAELGDQALVDDCLFRSYKPYMKPPFNVINEGPRGESVNFLTGAGLLQQFVYAYTGLRLSEDEGVTPKYKPMLPTSIKKMTLKNVTIRGRKFDLVVEGNTLKRISAQAGRN
jgi:trehalose/maltose hydrolase-like predicted phosphorylase